MLVEQIDPAAAFAELGSIKLGQTTLDGVLASVAGLAKRALPAAAEVSVTLVVDERAHTAAYTGDLALALDKCQYELGDGPCLDAAAGRAMNIVRDMADEARWPGWCERAAAQGIGSSLSIGMPVGDHVNGALNIYGSRPDAFDDAAIRLAQRFAEYAAVALANAHLYDTTASLAEHMQAAMESRAVIEQAKGIIMGERRCTADEAFATLTKVSRDSNRKLRDVAATLVARAANPARPSRASAPFRRR